MISRIVAAISLRVSRGSFAAAISIPARVSMPNIKRASTSGWRVAEIAGLDGLGQGAERVLLIQFGKPAHPQDGGRVDDQDLLIGGVEQGVKEAVDGRGQDTGGVLGPQCRGFDRFEHPPVNLLEDRFEQGGLRAEVVIERPDRHPGIPRDVVDAGGRVARCPEALVSGVDQGLAGLRDLLGAQAGSLGHGTSLGLPLVT